MPSFLTQCPHCLTPFRVTETQLEAAAGQVRCGACLGIFSATSNRITLKQTPEEAVAGERAEPDTAEPDEIEHEEVEFTEETLTPADRAPEAETSPPELAFAATLNYAPTEEYTDEAPLQEELAAEPEEVTPPLQREIVVAEFTADPMLDLDPQERDFDIPLGDFELDADAEFEDDDEYEDDSGSDDDDIEDDDEEPEDEDDSEEQPEDEYEFEEEYTEDELPEPVARRAPHERITTDKTELRQYLAEIEDDDALDPLDDSALDAFTDEPVTLVAATGRSGVYTFALFSVNLLLVLLLAGQYIHANLETLARNPRLATVMPYVCRAMECPEPVRSQLASLVSEQLLVRSHPLYAQALEVSFVFRNDAREAQPFPAIELGFRNTNNELMANRLFQPAQYLPRELQTSSMPPQSSLQITLEMADPGSEAVNYTLAFREP